MRGLKMENTAEYYEYVFCRFNPRNPYFNENIIIFRGK